MSNEEIRRAISTLEFRSGVGADGLEEEVYDLSQDVYALRTLVLEMAWMLGWRKV